MSDTKNSIHSRLQVDRLELPFDQLHGMVAVARDQFHSFIAKTVKCNYKRPAIYLVDAWVTRALGLFLAKGDLRVLEEVISGNGDGGSSSRRMADFSPIYELLRSIADYEERLQGLRIFDLSAELSQLWQAVVGLVGGEGSSADCSKALGRVSEPVAALWRTIVADADGLGAHASVMWHQAFTDCENQVRRNLGKPLPREPRGLIRGFGEGRSSGILLQDIPELDIRAPAVLLSPLSIMHWAEDHPRVNFAPEQVEQWLGTRDRTMVGFSLALGNVVQHELTHVLLGLSNDPNPREDSAQVRQQWSLYERMPEIEEGICNFVANLVTLNTVSLAEKEVRNHQIVSYRKSPEILRRHRPLIDALTGDYFSAETSCLWNAWERTGMSFGDFGGVLNAYATHIKDNNWDGFYEHLGEGRIVVERRS